MSSRLASFTKNQRGLFNGLENWQQYRSRMNILASAVAEEWKLA